MSITWKVDRTQLVPQFAADVDALLSADPGDWFVTYGFRTREEQAALYATYLKGGPLAAPPGSSAHEFGLAVDVTLVLGGSDDWNYKDSSWRRMIHAVHLAPRLHSLDDYGDSDHIESVNWRAIATANATAA